MSAELVIEAKASAVPPAWELPVAIVLALAVLGGTNNLISDDYDKRAPAGCTTQARPATRRTGVPYAPAPWVTRWA